MYIRSDQDDSRQQAKQFIIGLITFCNLPKYVRSVKISFLLIQMSASVVTLHP